MLTDVSVESKVEEFPLDQVAQQEIIRRAQAGDYSALERCLSYLRPIIAALVSHYASGQDAEDLCQEILSRISLVLPGFRFGSKLSTWATAIAKNWCIDGLKRRERHVHLQLLSDVLSDEEDRDAMEGYLFRDDAANPETIILQSAQQNELTKMIASILGQLSPRDRDVLYLHYYRGMNFREIGAHFGKFDDDAKQISSNWIPRALRRVKRHLIALSNNEESYVVPK